MWACSGVDLGVPVSSETGIPVGVVLFGCGPELAVLASTLLLQQGQEHFQKGERHKGSLFLVRPAPDVEVEAEQGVFVQMTEHMAVDLHSVVEDAWDLVRHKFPAWAKKQR
jgi:hypothetical protein